MLRRILAFSSGFVGLWSSVKSTASRPFSGVSRPSTPRESPTQAVVSLLPCRSSEARGDAGWSVVKGAGRGERVFQHPIAGISVPPNSSLL